MQPTGVITEGDYIMGGIWYCDIWYPYGENTKNFFGTIYVNNIYYYADLDKESEIDVALSGIESEIETNFMATMNAAGCGDKITDKSSKEYQYYMAKEIYQYIANNVIYDNDHLPLIEYREKYSAYSAIVKKKTVCNGYSLMFYRIACEEGLDARYVQGLAGSTDENTGLFSSIGGHAWNMVKINGFWYCLDVTWDAQKSKYEYFLIAYQTFYKTHHESCDYYEYDISTWKLANSPYTVSEKIIPIKIHMKVTPHNEDGSVSLKVGETLSIEVSTEPSNATMRYFALKVEQDSDIPGGNKTNWYYFNFSGFSFGNTLDDSNSPVIYELISPGKYKMTARKTMAGKLSVYLPDTDDTSKEYSGSTIEYDTPISLNISGADSIDNADHMIVTDDDDNELETGSGHGADYLQYISGGEEIPLHVKTFDSDGKEIEGITGTWRSSNENVVRVDSSTGVLTGYNGGMDKNGTAIVTVSIPGTSLEKTIYVEEYAIKTLQAAPSSGTMGGFIPEEGKLFNNVTILVPIIDYYFVDGEEEPKDLYITDVNKDQFSGSLYYWTDEQDEHGHTDSTPKQIPLAPNKSGDSYTNQLTADAEINDSDNDGEVVLHAYVEYTDPISRTFKSYTAKWTYDWEANEEKAVHLSSDTPGAVLHAIGKNGTGNASLRYTVLISAMAEGYSFDHWDEVLDDNGNRMGEEVCLENDRAARTTFTMPKGEVYLKAFFTKDSTPGCDHDYEWVVENEATQTKNALMVYKCKKCGHIQQRMTDENSAYLKYNQDAAYQIKNAKIGQSVTIKSDIWQSFHRCVFDALAKRPDVTLIVDYRFNGKSYSLTIPAGTDVSNMPDKAGFCGFRSLEAKLLQTTN